MSKIRNTEITDKRGFQHPCYVATATQNLKDYFMDSLPRGSPGLSATADMGSYIMNCRLSSPWQSSYQCDVI